jgi:hypothetical protein
VTEGGVDGAQDAVGRRRDFQRDLVGLQFDEQFVLLDRVADLLGPFRDGGLGDGFTEGGGQDVGHVGSSCLFGSIR